MADEKKTKKAAEEKAAKSDKKKSDKKSDKNKSGKNPFKAIGGFFKSVRSEGKKVVWPKAAEVWKNTLVVLVVIIIVGLVIYAVDFGLTTGMKALKNVANTTTSVSEEAAEGNESETELVEQTTKATTEAADTTKAAY